jgi:hypothetical protein
VNTSDSPPLSTFMRMLHPLRARAARVATVAVARRRARGELVILRDY